MELGSDFIKWFHFIMAIVKLMIKVFGTSDEKTKEDEFTNNHDHDCQRVIDSA